MFFRKKKKIQKLQRVDPERAKIGNATEFATGLLIGLGLAIALFVLKHNKSNPDFERMRVWLSDRFPRFLDM